MRKNSVVKALERGKKRVSRDANLGKSENQSWLRLWLPTRGSFGNLERIRDTDVDLLPVRVANNPKIVFAAAEAGKPADATLFFSLGHFLCRYQGCA